LVTDPLLPCIWAAGVLQLLIASVNLVAPKKLAYRENLAKLSPIVREVFIVQNVFIVLTLVGFAALCLWFAPELTGQSLLGRSLSGFLAVFWGLRLLFQLFFYNPQIKQQHPVINLAFVLADLYLAGVFTLAAVRAGG
jgi:alginate O-acetyltransferase complex protein AlgI